MNIYTTEFNQDGIPCLVAERHLNYNTEQELDSPAKVNTFIRNILGFQNKTEEYLYLICLNAAQNVVGAFELSHGTVNSSLAGMREIFMKALLTGCKSIVLTHNHPSGKVQPSPEDITLTSRLYTLALMFDIPLLDHIIVGPREEYYSFLDNTMLKSGNELFHSMLITEFGEAVRMKRTEKRMTLEELAEATNLQVSVIRNIENGVKKPSAVARKKLVTYFDIKEEVIYS